MIIDPNSEKRLMKITTGITAEEARALNPHKAAENHLRDIFSNIATAAKTGKTSVRFPYVLTEIRGEGSVSVKNGPGDVVASTLRSLGYKIKDHWDCGQFVDAYLTIEWGDDE